MRRHAFRTLLLLLPAVAGAYDNLSLLRTVEFEKQVREPADAAVDASGRVIAADAAQDRLSVVGPDGKPAGNWGAKGKEPGKFSGPRGVAVDARGRVYVADSGNHRVQVFSPDGRPLHAIGTKGDGTGQLDSPSAVAVTHDGFLFVCDTGNHRVQVFSDDGLYFYGFGGPGSAPGQLKDPSDIAVSRGGTVFVLDKGNRRVQKFSTSGKSLGAVGAPGSTGKEPEALPDPAALAVDDYGYLYVADAEQNKIKEFGPDGRFIGTFGTWGTGPGQFKKITGVDVAPDGTVAVTDAAVRRVQLFRLESRAKVRKLGKVPTLRLRVEPLPPVALAVDRLSFAGDTLLGVSAKTHQLLRAANAGHAAPVALGGKGKGPDQLNVPLHVTVSSGTVYVTDNGNRRVLIWDASGKPLPPGQVGGSGKREGQFKDPRAAAVDAEGRLIVADAALARCQVFSRDGIFLYTLGEPGQGKGQFASPVDVAAAGDRVAVADPERHTVLIFDGKGKFQTEIAGLSQPVAVAAHPSGRWPFFFVLDAQLGQVRVYKDNGQYVAGFGSSALFTGPKAIALDERGRLWVADGTELKSYEVTLLPAAPADLKASAGEGQVSLRWSPDAENLSAAYAVYRATSADVEPSSYAVVSATETPFIDLEIVPGLTYYYAVAGLSDAPTPEERQAGARASVRAATTRPANLPSLDITALKLENVFSAQYKYYVDHPVGKVTIKNNTEKVFQKVRVGFIIQDFMDYPTEAVVDRLNPGAPWSGELKAVFNNKILSVSEDTPIQAQVTATYYEDGAEKTFNRTQSFKLYSRNAMSWEDPRRIATFVTPKDPPVLEFARAAAKAFNDEAESSPLGRPIVLAQALFNTLGTYGLSYQQDPNNPFGKAVQDVKSVDYVQYPRETLKRKSGDCDDLVNLYASMLESVTVPTAMIDVPGHILMMFRVADEGDDTGLPDDRLVTEAGGLWVPVEVTQVGRPFEEAWREGAKVYRRAADEGKAEILDVHAAWAVYSPATLAEEPAPTPPSREDVLKKFPDDLAKTEGVRLENLVAGLKKAAEADPKDAAVRLELGLAYAEHRAWKEAGDWFDQAIALDGNDAAALNNRGNVHMALEEPAKAAEFYLKAATADEKDAGLRLNLSRAAWKSGDKAQAEKSFQQALALDPELKKSFKTLTDLVE
jgi:sugar lactone lactonase YvrE/tetratricopeptide (TPR) repeat protein